MVEGEGTAFLLPAYHLLGQNLILLEELGQVFLVQSPGLVRRADHRLHAQLGEAQVGHVEDVVGEIYVVVGEGASHVVFLVPALFHETLELGHDDVVAALTGKVLAQAVVDLLAAVQGEDHVVHFLVAELGDLIVQQHAVGGEGEAEVLLVDGLQGTGVADQVLHHIPVHEGFAAKEVHLQVHPGAGVGHQEVQSLLAHLKGHESPVALVVALAGEAVVAVQVAGVGHVETHGLQNGLGGLECGLLHVLPQVLGEELAAVLQGLDVFQAVPQFLLVHVLHVAVLGQHLGDDLLVVGVFKEGDHVIGHLVHQVDGAAVDVHNDVVSV